MFRMSKSLKTSIKDQILIAVIVNNLRGDSEVLNFLRYVLCDSDILLDST